MENCHLTGGKRGIRTLDTTLQSYGGLANRCLKPLGHLSKKDNTIRSYNILKFCAIKKYILLKFYTVFPFFYVSCKSFLVNIWDFCKTRRLLCTKEKLHIKYFFYTQNAIFF